MIKIENLSKSYVVYKRRRSILLHAFGYAVEGRDYDCVHSLTDLCLEVPKGTVHGVIGMNGAGKSTLLKILTGVLLPSSGRVHMEGRVAALLELGTGFHGELTGRQNVLLNASIMGLDARDAEKRLPAIQEFAELGDFFDRPVKIYSSGMYVRLAFAFSVSVDPEILIIDEALSVGDAYFQQKCLRKIESYKNSGTTILFVSHDLGAVRALCQTVTLLDRGKVIFTGSSMQALDLYNDLLADFRSSEIVAQKASLASEISPLSSYESGTREVRVDRVLMRNHEGKEALAVVSGNDVTIEIECSRSENFQDPELTCGILLRDRLGYEIFGTNTYHLKRPIVMGPDCRTFRLKFDFKMNLGAGDYVLTVALHSHQSHVTKNYHWVERALLFKVLPSIGDQFIGVARLDPSCSVTFSL